MFQSLRPNSPIYIFYKNGTPHLERGYVTAQPIPRQKYPTTNFGHPEMVVDIVAKIDGMIVNYTNLPAQADIADSFSNGESIVLSDNKEAMNAEILSLKQKSIDILNSVDTHKALIDNCDTILSELNPEFAEKKAQQDEMTNLKNQMNEMTSKIEMLMSANRSLIERLNKDK